MKHLLILALLGSSLMGQVAQVPSVNYVESRYGNGVSATPVLPVTCSDPQVAFRTSAPIGWNYCVGGVWEPGLSSTRVISLFNSGTCSGYLKSNGTCDTPASAGIPSGLITLSTAACPSGFTEVTALDGQFLQGTLAAHGDVGTSGGNATITPTGSVSQPTFSGSQSTSSAVSAGTPAGTNGTVSFTPAGTNGTGTVTPAGTVAWPAGVPAFSGSAGTVPAETFTGSSATSSAVSAGTPAGTNAASATSGNCAATNIAAGTGSTTACKATAPNLTVTAQTFTGSALATHTHTLTATGTNGTAAFTPAGTIAWPVGVPAFSGSSSPTSAQTFTGSLGTIPAELFTGSALGTHTHTLTPAGTVSQPTFTGNPVDPRPLYTKVIFCSKD